jgi:magnesium-protoporphyrin O-methyltransferase
MEQLVGLSARQARKLYGLVYPRDVWWMRIVMALENVYYRLRRNPYRAFIHPTKAVESVLGKHGLKRRSHHQTLAWQVSVYTR